MRLYFLDPTSRTLINVARLRRCGYDVRRIIAQSVEILNALVVIGNGSPDDKVLGALSYHLDGGTIVGVVKPRGRTGLSVLDQLKTYVSRRIKKIMVLIDRDDSLLEQLFGNALDRIRGIGINVSHIEEVNNLRVYQCTLGSRQFEVVIVANGLEEVGTTMHTIEDHLTTAAGIQVAENSKQSWNSLGRNRKEEVFRRLKEQGNNVIEKLFPQQVCGFRLLEDEPNPRRRPTKCADYPMRTNHLY